MTIRMLQAWNGLPQQAITTLDGAEESRLVALGLASLDLDGQADNLRMAQLATDAGLSAGGATYYASMFGMDAGDVSDQSAKIQSAIDKIAARGRGALILPEGDIYIGSPIYLRNKVSLMGCGKAATLIRPTGDFDAIRVWTDYTGGDIDRTQVSGLSIIYPSASYTLSTGISIQSSASGNVWKPVIKHVQVYQPGVDGIAILGTAGSTVIEHTLYDVEVTRCRRHGVNQNYYVYDAHFTQVFADAGSAGSSGYGFYIQGGSGTYLHCHAVAHGSNNGSGTYAGGGFRVDSGYNTFLNCHADRCASHGWVVGAFGADPARKENAFYNCLGFNSGVYYPDIGLGSVTNTASNWRIGHVDTLLLDAIKAGKLGSSYPYANGRGINFESTTINNVMIRGGRVSENVTGIVIGAGVGLTKINVRGLNLDSNTTPISGAYANEWSLR